MSGAGILELPCELIANIFRQLDRVDQLLPARLACRHFNDAFLEHPGLPLEILSRQVHPSLLPYAIAAFQCSRKTTTLDSSKAILAQLHGDPTELDERTNGMTFEVIMALSKRHAIVQGLSASFANAAWALMDSERSLTLSAAEEIRFCIAFYRFDLLCAFLRAQHRSRADASRALSEAKNHLLSPFPPWSNEQVGCVHDFLENTLLNAIHETVAHDVDLGEYSVSYMDYGIDNFWLQNRLSRGLEGIHKLVQTNPGEEQAKILEPQDDDAASTVAVFDVICSEMDAEGDDVSLEDYSASELEALIPQRNLASSDTGPYEAWYQSHKEMVRNGFVLFGGDDGLRMRAYVFWDAARLREYGLLEQFRHVGEYVTHRHQHTDEEYEAMLRSFDERSKIWQKGGRGMWYEGDESRIVWPS